MADAKPLLWVKRYATGKFTIHADGGTAYDDKITAALARSGSVIATLDERRFRENLAASGVPSDVIDAVVKSIKVFDDTFDAEHV